MSRLRTWGGGGFMKRFCLGNLVRVCVMVAVVEKYPCMRRRTKVSRWIQKV